MLSGISPLKVKLVVLEPALGLDVANAARLLHRHQCRPATIHCAGVWSCAETHSSRFLPSKSTIASEGGAVSFMPGVTIAGTGVQTSVSFRFWFGRDGFLGDEGSGHGKHGGKDK